MLLVEATHCGICHSDLHIWEGYFDIGKEWAPGTGQNQAAALTVGRTCCSSNCTGLR